MRVLQLVSSAGMYGAERMLLNLASGLSAEGCEVTIAALASRNPESTRVLEEANAIGLATKAFLCAKRVDRHALLELKAFAAEHRFDVVHTHGYKANIYGYAAFRRHSKLISTVHSRDPHHASVKLYTWLDGIALRRFDHIVTVTPELRLRLCSSGFAKERLTFISNGVPVPRVPSSAPANTAKIAYVGRLSYEKAPDVALAALVELNRRSVSFEAHFLGDGEMRAEIEATIAGHGLMPRVALHGRVSDPWAAVPNLAVVLMPSRSEAMPMALLEAMAHGLPVVATRVGAVPSIVQHGVTGLLVGSEDIPAMADGLQALLSQPDLRNSMGAAARKKVVDQYSVDSMCAAYLEIYRGELRRKSVPTSETFISEVKTRARA